MTTCWNNIQYYVLFMYIYGLLIYFTNAQDRDLLMFEVETITDLDEAASSKQQFLIYNPDSSRYLFVSNDARRKDNVVEAHKYQYETRNIFQLEKLGDGSFRFFNSDYKRWFFVSNDRRGYNHVLEAHPYFTETRNQFKLIQAPNQPNGHYLILNLAYGLSLFVSNDKSYQDMIIEANRIDPNNQNGIEKYIFVLQGIKGIMGSRNDDIYDFDNYQYDDPQERANKIFWIVVVLYIFCCGGLLIKICFFDQDNLSKFK